MTQVVWNGEDHLHNPGSAPLSTMWNGRKVHKGQPIDIEDPVLLDKVRSNPFFSVLEDKDKDEPEHDTPKPPAKDPAKEPVKMARARQPTENKASQPSRQAAHARLLNGKKAKIRH